LEKLLQRFKPSCSSCWEPAPPLRLEFEIGEN